MVTPLPVKEQFSLSISQFPESLHGVLREIDDEGNGKLELDEITEVFTTYAEQKKAEKEGTIALSQLPKELRPTLKVFDVDGDGTVGAIELANAAQMYKDSKSMTKRLTKAVAVLLLIMIALVGTIVGLTAHVVEEAKETRTDSSGITKVKGTDQPTASGSVVAQNPLSESFTAASDALDAVKSLRLVSPDDAKKEFSYTITGWMRDAAAVNFYAARGDVITVDTVGNVSVKNAAGAEVLRLNKPSGGRHLQSFPFFPLMISGSFTMMAASGEF